MTVLLYLKLMDIMKRRKVELYRRAYLSTQVDMVIRWYFGCVNVPFSANYYH